MKKRRVIFMQFFLSVLVGFNLYAKDKQELKKIDIFNIGTISYPEDIEERSDIPFKNLVDEEYRNILGDTVDYERFRPSLIFLEKGFECPSLEGKKIQFGYISLTALTGTYQIPRTLSDEQKKKLEDNIKRDALASLDKTSFKITKWYPFEFKEINGLPAVQYHFEQSLNGKNKTDVEAIYIYDNDVQFQLILATPRKEYKKWLKYYKKMQGNIKRKINVANVLTFEFPTTIQNKKDIPFKYLVDKEFRQILGDSIDYEAFRPNMLLLDRHFVITDSLNIAPFANMTLNYIPSYEEKAVSIDSMNIAVLEQNVKQNVEQNLIGTNYKVSKWNPFVMTEVQGLPMLQYSYEQQLGENEPSEVYASYIFDKSGQIQFGMSSPKNDINEWKSVYNSVLSSVERLLSISGVGTVLYPISIDERNDIPFATLVDEQSKKKLGDSIDFEQFRPMHIFLKKGFDEKNPSDLNSFNSITLNTSYGDFTHLCNKDSISGSAIEESIKASVTRNLSNTSYILKKWDSFEVKDQPEARVITYSYVQGLDDTHTKHIVMSYLYTTNCQITFTLTCAESDYPEWFHEYKRLVDSFKPLGKR